MEEIKEKLSPGPLVKAEGEASVIIVPTEEGTLWKGLLDAFDDDDDELRADILIAEYALEPYVAEGWEGIDHSNSTLYYSEEWQFNTRNCNHLTCLWMLLKLQCLGESTVKANSVQIKPVKDRVKKLTEESIYTEDWNLGIMKSERKRFERVESLVRQFVRGTLFEPSTATKAMAEHEQAVTETVASEADLSDDRKSILEQLADFVAKGEWVEPSNNENIAQMIRDVLGVGTLLNNQEKNLSEELWHLLLKGRGDRVRVVWQNIAGFLASQKFLNGTSPELCRMFFGDSKDYTNIDKGRKQEQWSKGFAEVVPLLEKYIPKQ